jgi:hypothetical protein
MDGVWDQNPCFFLPILNRFCYKLKRDLQLNRCTHTHTYTHRDIYKVQSAIWFTTATCKLVVLLWTRKT